MNRFFTVEDKKIDFVGGFKIPATWWSRPYEYAFVLDYLGKEDTILDIGCGLEHPFKHYAGEKCKRVVALDVDERVLNIKDDNVEFVICDVLNYNPDFKFDKIFAISTLEHTSDYLEEKFENMKNMLKEDGKIILTVDYPLLMPDKLLKCAKKANLVPTSNFNEVIPKNALYHYQYSLSVYSVILEHEKKGDKSLNVSDRKVKIEKPLRIKRG